MFMEDCYFYTVSEALDEIRKLHKEYMIDEKRVKKAEKAVEDSMDTRLAVKDKLASCSAQGDMEQLEKKVKSLSVAKLNENVSCFFPHRENKVI